MLKKNNTKPVFITKGIWNKVQLYFKKNDAHKYKTFYIYSRNSTVTKNLIIKRLFIRVGNGWKKLKINKWRVGFKFGAFTLTRTKWQKKDKKRPTKPKKK